MTAPRDISVRLQDIRDAATESLQFLQAVDLEHYLSDRMRCLAVERLLLLIGDAAVRATDENPVAMASLHELPKIVALRNRITNGYWLTDHHLVHALREDVLPQLLEDLERLQAEVDAGRIESPIERDEAEEGHA